MAFNLFVLGSSRCIAVYICFIEVLFSNFLYKLFNISPYFRALANLGCQLENKLKYLCVFIINMQNICNLIETACILPIFLIATVQISMECEMQENEVGDTKHLNLYYLKTYMCSYRANQHLIVQIYEVFQSIKF